MLILARSSLPIARSFALRFPSNRSCRRPLFPTLFQFVAVVSQTSQPNHLQASALSTMPQPPYHYRSASAPVLDLSALGLTLTETENSRQLAYDLSRRIHIQLVKARADLELPTTTTDMTSTALADVSTLLQSSIESSKSEEAHPRAHREANLSNRVEEYLRLYSFHHFLTHGNLVAPSACLVSATDEEYLAGACMGFCQDLARYGIGRATARDLASVQMTRDLVNQVLDYLLQFDFRNGPLRRKYDGIKYALKTLETLLYELSVTGATMDSDEPDAKRARIEAESALHVDELDALRKRMEHRDEIREKLIKKCRDGQKAAKQAIYALHRGDKDRATTLLSQCEECISKDLLPIIDEEPPLRSGSFSNVLEEYVEARLFYVWLFGQDGTESSKANGHLLKPDEFVFALEPQEYLGGLCDLTGEIGRYAVQRGTARDAEGVRMCLEANAAVMTAIQTMDRYPGNIGKKMDQLRRSVEKLERMTYEMSLSEATGRKVDTEAVQPSDTNNDSFDISGYALFDLDSIMSQAEADILLSLVGTESGEIFAAGHAGWIADEGSSLCNWYGISCGDTAYVTKISLTGYPLDTTITPALAALSNLEELTLVNCGLTGTLPPDIAALSNLKVLDVSFNSLTGDIPSILSTRLVLFSAADNRFQGSLSNLKFDTTSNLKTFDVQGNQLSGTLPEEFFLIETLQNLDLSNNYLSGTIYDGMTKSSASTLQRLHLQANRLQGSLPAILPRNLLEIHIHTNELTGSIPGTWASLERLQSLLLHDNRITGTIPSLMCEKNLNEELFVNGAVLEGENLGGDFLQTVRDGCSSIACPAGLSSPTGYFPCQSCEDSVMNPYVGAQRCNDYSESEILDILYASTGGDNWVTGQDTWLNEALSVCDRKGIVCSEEGHVSGINLSSIGLSGSIPLELGFLEFLADLDVSNNALTGTLPEELSLPPLQKLDLSENQLKGYVPKSLCEKRSVNGNGMTGVFDCDIIACPMGTFHPLGRADPLGEGCQTCSRLDGLVLANANCHTSNTMTTGAENSIAEWLQVMIACLIGLILIFFGFWVLRLWRPHPPDKPPVQT